MYPFLAFFLTLLTVLALGWAILVVRVSRRRRVSQRVLQRAEMDGDSPAPALSTPLRALNLLGALASMGSPSQRLRKRLSLAGYYSPHAPTVYMGAKLLLLAAAVGLLPLLIFCTSLPRGVAVLIFLLAMMAVFFVPDAVLSSRRRSRARSVRRHLPDAVDLMEVCVTAGIGLDLAWNMVSGEIRRVCPILADEMALTNLEMHLGAARVEAMRHLADRTGVDDIRRLVAVLVQSERFGTSIADALRTFATTMRENRSMMAEESAEKLAVAMVVPMILFIFPAVFVVSVGPASITIARMMLK
ncbi:MAG: type II secretion system F family protein [Planctomycetaceae bacterium]|nr:type II secretion system F family protein [Planctomycetaceae bacterium]